MGIRTGTTVGSERKGTGVDGTAVGTGNRGRATRANAMERGDDDDDDDDDAGDGWAVCRDAGGVGSKVVGRVGRRDGRVGGVGGGDARRYR